MRFFLFLSLLALVSCNNDKPQQLFNGKDLSGWEQDVPELDTNSNAPKPFIVRNGVLVSLGKPEGHVISTSAFKNYRLTVEYRFPSVAGNSGILVHTSAKRALYEMFPQSLEVQLHHGDAGDFWCIKENIQVADMEKRRGPKTEWGVDGEKKKKDTQPD